MSPANPPSDAIPLRILIIDDHALVARTIGTGLQDEGMTVDVCYDGLSGYEILSQPQYVYNVVITDHNMLGLTGEELVRKLRGNGYTRPIILLSGYVRPWDEPIFLEAGVNRILTKPAKPQDLLAAVHELTEAFPLA